MAQLLAQLVRLLLHLFGYAKLQADIFRLVGPRPIFFHLRRVTSVLSHHREVKQ